MNVDISIIFVNYKTKELTINAIDSVIEKTEGVKYEIFVVDNDSNDGSIEAIEQQFPNINIIKSKINGGFGYANNLAIKQAKGKYVLCLNTDTLLVNNAIKIMFDYMEQHDNVGICGGTLLDKNLLPIESFGYYPTYYNLFIRYGLLRMFKPTISEKQKIIIVDFVIGADFFIRKSVIDKTLGFDEKIFMYTEEMDLSYRTKLKGFSSVILQDAKIIHLCGKSSNSDFTFFNILKGNFYFVRKHKIISEFILKIYFLFKYLVAYIITFKKIYIKAIQMIINNNLNY